MGYYIFLIPQVPALLLTAAFIEFFRHLVQRDTL